MIGEDIEAALPELRAQAESLMRSRCTIERHDGSTWQPIHVDIPCRITLPSVASRSLLTDEAVTSETPVVKVSVEHTGVEPDDRVTINGSTVAWVTHAPDYDDMVQIRLQCRWSR